MIDPETTKAIANATGELAKASGPAISLIKDAGEWVSKTLGQLPENLVGIVGDNIREIRFRNFLRQCKKTEEFMEGIAPERISQPSLSVIVPLLTSSVNESRDALQDLWAALLAQAAIDGGNRARREYFEVLSKIEPLDAKVLWAISKNINQPVQNISDLRGIDRVEQGISFRNLIKLELIARLIPEPDKYYLSDFGHGFLLACALAKKSDNE